MTKMAILGNQATTALVIETLVDCEIELSAIINLSEESGKKIGEYIDHKNLASTLGLRHFYVDSYSLTSAQSELLFKEEAFDFVFVVGWGRLIPPKLIQTLNTKFVGWHGGPYLPPRCRGRAVVNWSIINNESDFFVYTMMLDKGVDSGRILDTSSVSIESDETANSLYIKCAIEVAKLLKNFINTDFKNLGSVQAAEGLSYLPKRSPEDGEIDWALSSKSIARLVRALSNPFPSAWSGLHGEKFYVKRAKSVDIKLPRKYEAGQIASVLPSGELLVQTTKGLLLIEEYSFCKNKLIKKLDHFHQSGLLMNVTKSY